MSKPQSPRTWLITGADKGLGHSAAKAALEQGDNVVVTVLARDASHDLTARFPDRLRSIHLDARDVDRVPGVVAQAHAAFGRIDVLVNNAGYGLVGLIEETEAAKYRALFDVNYFGLVEMTRAVLPIMRAQRSGHIINLSSTAGFAATGTGFGHYSASKHAVEGLSEVLANEVRPLGIRVTIVEPGPFRSDFAGGSLDTRISDNPDYGAAADYVRTYQANKHGKQPNDPARFGPAICRLVAAENPPMRLPLGVEAVQHLRDSMARVEEDLKGWQELSYSVRFPD